MKIGIVTLPFNSNYGGILQAYALQSVLKKMGHQVATVNRTSKGQPLYFKLASFTKRFVQRYLLGKKVVVRTWPNKNEKAITAQHTRRFIEQNISLTPVIKSEKEMSKLKKGTYNAWVVGSDQVWRPKYSPSLSNHFLGFLNSGDASKKISFAPSFGVDNWEYSPEETRTCGELLKRFHAVSLREESAVDLCKANFNLDASHVVDPTLLIEKEEYLELVKKDKLLAQDIKLLTYILDKSSRVRNMVVQAEQYFETKAYSTTRPNSFKEVGQKGLDKCIFPPVTELIRGFNEAEFVMTDSFHGTVFCIIFNKPFIALGNTKRGMSRFASLLKTFGLEDRLVTEKDANIEPQLESTIDFEKVNEIVRVKKKEALDFLNNALNN